MSLQPVIRIGDGSDHGGQMISGANKTTVDGIAVCRVGDMHTCPIPGHGTTPLVSGSGSFRCEGAAVGRIREDRVGCGAVIMGGSPTTKSS